MKKILLIVCMTLGCILSNAQGRMFCELVGMQTLLGKTIVSVDFGQVSLFSDNRIVDENGEPMVVYYNTNSRIFINRETGENWDDLDWRARFLYL